MRHLRKFIIVFVLAAFAAASVTPPARAQGIALPPVNEALALTPAFQPCLLRGLKLDARSPFNFEFVLDSGNTALEGDAFKAESDMLIRFFLAALTTPEKDIWVNLSPYENNRIVDDDFGRTTMGRELLAQDYILKQLTASLMHPDTALGKKFWDKIYDEAWKKYGTTDVPIDTFNKVWIMPASAVVHEGKDTGAERGARNLSAFIDEAHLKVMLETDYMAAEKAVVLQDQAPAADKDTREISQKIVRDIILPALEKEVNEGKNFARLRQVYYALLLAVWLKKKLKTAAVKAGEVKKKDNILSLIFVDHKKTGGIETADPRAEINGVYALYVQAFKEGVYNLIKEDYDKNSGELIPRKYFSGGFAADGAEAVIDAAVKKGERMAPLFESNGGLHNLAVLLQPAAKRLQRQKDVFRRTVTGIMIVLGPMTSISQAFGTIAATPDNLYLRQQSRTVVENISDWQIRIPPGLTQEDETTGMTRQSRHEQDRQIVDTALTQVLSRVNAIYADKGWKLFTEDGVMKKMRLSREQLTQALRNGYDKTTHLKKIMSYDTFVNTFFAIVWKESTFEANKYKHRSTATGLVGVMAKLSNGGNMKNPLENIARAFELWDEQAGDLDQYNKKYGSSKAAALARMLRGELNERDHRNRLHRLSVGPEMAKYFLNEDGALNDQARHIIYLIEHYAGLKSLTAIMATLKNVYDIDQKGKVVSTAKPSGYVVLILNTAGVKGDGSRFIVLHSLDKENASAYLLAKNTAAPQINSSSTEPQRLPSFDADKGSIFQYLLTAWSRIYSSSERQKDQPWRWAMDPRQPKSPNMADRLDPLGPFLADNASISNTGGIDLKTGAMDLLMRGQGGDIAFELTPAQIDMLRQGVSGFVPVILDVKPMGSLPLFMGMESGNSGAAAA